MIGNIITVLVLISLVDKLLAMFKENKSDSGKGKKKKNKKNKINLEDLDKISKEFIDEQVIKENQQALEQAQERLKRLEERLMSAKNDTLRKKIMARMKIEDDKIAKYTEEIESRKVKVNLKETKEECPQAQEFYEAEKIEEKKELEEIPTILPDDPYKISQNEEKDPRVEKLTGRGLKDPYKIGEVFDDQEKQFDLARAVVLSEILGKPKAKRFNNYPYR